MERNSNRLSRSKARASYTSVPLTRFTKHRGENAVTELCMSYARIVARIVGIPGEEGRFEGISVSGYRDVGEGKMERKVGKLGD